MFTSVKTSAANKLIVSELTRKLSFGPENIIARIAFSYSLSKGERLSLKDIKDAKGKEYSKNVLFGNNMQYYIALICTRYEIHKSDKDIPKYIKLHIDHGLELIADELKRNSTLTSFDFLVNKIEAGLQ